MKYSKEIGIDLPVHRVLELFDNPDNIKYWQPELVSFEPLSGTPGEVGAKSKLKYKMGNRVVEMIETITKKNLPQEFAGTYEAKGVYNAVCNKFIPLSEKRTRWIIETEFRFKGFMRIIGLILPGSFKKQTEKYLKNFKAFAEKKSNKIISGSSQPISG